MTDDARPSRFYDEAEVGEILKRATELQRDEPSSRGVAGGMSLVELE